MIDEKLLMKKLKESGLDDSEDRWLLRFVQEIIDKLPKVGETDTNVGSKWILCSERMPEKEGYYLVSIRKNEFLEGDLRVKTLWFSELHEAFMGYGSLAIAWMPLPGAYVENPKVAAVDDAEWKQAMMRHFEKVE